MADLRQRAWARWQAAAGPWRGWAICPALTMPDAHITSGAPEHVTAPPAPPLIGAVSAPDHVTKPLAPPLIGAVSAPDHVTTAEAPSVASAAGVTGLVDLTDVLRIEGTAVVLDLDPVAGVRTAAHVSRRGMAHVVLVLPRWPHTDAVLPTAELVATLVEVAHSLRTQPVASNVVFVLDAERQQAIRRPAHDARVDNRYPIAASDLPRLALLRTAGIARVIKVASTR